MFMKQIMNIAKIVRRMRLVYDLQITNNKGFTCLTYYAHISYK